jgi:hypothetical protein
MSNVTTFKINTSKNSCTFCISLIRGHLKSSIISTSVNFDFKPPIINTSEKTGGGGSSCNSSCNWEFAYRADPSLRHGGLAAALRVPRPLEGGVMARRLVGVGRGELAEDG